MQWKTTNAGTTLTLRFDISENPYNKFPFNNGWASDVPEGEYNFIHTSMINDIKAGYTRLFWTYLFEQIF